jgi:hypothetical protein
MAERKPTLPQTPEELLNQLFEIFPLYRTNYVGPDDDETSTFHSVIREFVPFFGREARSLSEKQVRAFAALINAAVEEGSKLGHAFDTCLLEHLHQIKAERVLRPYLK